jgi:uncharacterized membrane protein
MNEFWEEWEEEDESWMLGRIVRKTLRWAFWGVCVLVAVPVWFCMWPWFGIAYLIEDSVWKD